MFVVADTGPPHYQALIGAIDVLPRLFGRVALPEVVRDQLRHSRAPELVRRWISDMPSWGRSRGDSAEQRSVVRGPGERAAIARALSRRADLVLIDDRRGAAAGSAANLRVIGTIGVLDRAALRGLVDLPIAVARLRQTNFRCRPELLDALLTQHGAKTQ